MNDHIGLCISAPFHLSSAWLWQLLFDINCFDSFRPRVFQVESTTLYNYRITNPLLSTPIVTEYWPQPWIVILILMFEVNAPKYLILITQVFNSLP